SAPRRPQRQGRQSGQQPSEGTACDAGQQLAVSPESLLAGRPAHEQVEQAGAGADEGTRQQPAEQEAGAAKQVRQQSAEEPADSAQQGRRQEPLGRQAPLPQAQLAGRL